MNACQHAQTHCGVPGGRSFLPLRFAMSGDAADAPAGSAAEDTPAELRATGLHMAETAWISMSDHSQ